ncbi:MAG: glycosyltransferase [Anaerolineae bacterium]|nr:glycosyltransferase [Anaerolineae bacterium]
MRSPTLTELPSPPPGKTGWPWTEVTAPLPTMMPNGIPWPRISIVTPSYNQDQFIEETIRSVLLQGYPNLEYIIMDGGSTDGSVEIIPKYEPWLAYWVSKPDDGQSAAIGEGFSHTTGDILAWMNSDDCYLPRAFARAARFFSAHRRAVFGSGDVNGVDVEGNFLHRVYAIRPCPFITANTGWHLLPQPGSFWRRGVYEQVGGMDASLRFCMDMDLFIRINKAGLSLRIPGPPIANARDHAEAKSFTILDVRDREIALLIKRYGNPGWANRPRLLMFLWRLWHKPRGLRKHMIHWFGWEY